MLDIYYVMKEFRINGRWFINVIIVNIRLCFIQFYLYGVTVNSIQNLI